MLQPRPLLLATLLLTPLACRAPAASVDPNAALRDATLGLGEAVAAARDRVPHGAVVDAEFEVGREGPVYEVEVLYGETVYEFYVDPKTGAIEHGDESSDGDELAEARVTLAVLKDAEVDFGQAIAAAERELGGRAYDAELTQDGYVIAVLTEQGPREAIVDFNNAAILSTREAEAGPEVETEEDPDEPEDEKDRM